MEGARLWEIVGGELQYPRPGRQVPVAAPEHGAAPGHEDMVTEGCDGRRIGWHRIVGEVSANDLPQPLPELGNGLVHTPAQRGLDLPELRLHAVAAGCALHEEAASPPLGADVGEAQEVEGLRLSEPALLAIGRRMAAKLDDAGLCRVQRQ